MTLAGCVRLSRACPYSWTVCLFLLTATGVRSELLDSVKTYDWTGTAVARADLPRASAGITRVGGGWRVHSLLRLEGEATTNRASALSKAFAAVGTESWTVRAGRQALSFGDERLISSNQDDPREPRYFDGVRATGTHGGLSIDAFVTAALSGLHSSIALNDRASIEPWLYRTGSTVASGFIARAELLNFTLNSEVALESQNRWAAHWEARRSTGHGQIGAEFNLASRGFDEMFPAALNAFGTDDPFPWSDTRNVAANWDMPLSSSWKAGLSYRSYWSTAGEYMAQHVVGSVSWTGKQWRVTAGYGQLLRTAVAHVTPRSPVLALGYSF